MTVVYKISDSVINSIVLSNPVNFTDTTLVPNTMYSAGIWSVTPPADISESGCLNRFFDGNYCTLGYSSVDEASEVYIKELAFFTSIEQAYSYYDGKYYQTEAPILHDALTFGSAGNVAVTVGDGNHTIDTENDTLDITFAESTSLGHRYLAKIKPMSPGDVSLDYFYVRILYSAEIRGDASRAKLSLYDDGTGASTAFVTGLTDTNGKYVLTDTETVTYETMNRFAAGENYEKPQTNTIAISDPNKDSVYKIKAIYFFPTKEDADRFIYSGGDSTLLVNGNDISKYQIVTEKDPAVETVIAANKLKKRIRDISGVLVPIVTDVAPVSEFEILVGQSERELSRSGLDDLTTAVNNHYIGVYSMVGDTLVFTSNIPLTLDNLTDKFITDYLYGGLTNTPDTLSIEGEISGQCYIETAKKFSEWKAVTNVEDPETLTLDFTTDEGYFTEDNGADNFIIVDGMLSCGELPYAHTYIHVFEKNTEATAQLMITDAVDNAEFGLTARHTADASYIKAGFDIDKNEWFIEEREGIDFYKSRYTAPATTALKGDTLYELTLLVDGSYATLYLDGVEVIEAKVSQTTPGRVGVFAESCAVSVDAYSVSLLSGQGTVLRNVVHTKLPNDRYFEGGTVWVMDDGTLQYQHHSGIAYTSADNGVTWQESERFTTMSGYQNMIRLNNGEWLKMVRSGGAWISQTSADGIEWVDGGEICQTPSPGSTAGAGNMNDKIFQSATTGRIFYGQNYETTKEAVDGRMVFCEFYYSDDNGATWTKSETDSWELVGNENEAYFGECKMLECADGTIRMYNSWNKYGCIVYSESKDNGVTWGPLVEMKEFVCPQSSMQWVRDPYADNDTTYYMVWVYGPIHSVNAGQCRSRLSLAKTTDGKNWEYLGDIWRWENNWEAPKSRALISHVVDPFIQVTEDYIICGSGFSEQIAKPSSNDNTYHQAQRQHIYSIRKDSLTAKPLPAVQ